MKYKIEKGGRYRIDDYDQISAFSSFLPGIGGPDGVPLWCMYVNRGQSVVSFGVANKDSAIAEFLPATWAYQLVTTQGFRTFCKIDGKFYEPFQKDKDSVNYDLKRSMFIEPDRLSISEANNTLSLTFDVEYFSPVNKPVGSLLRLLTITNNSKETKKITALDGLGLMLPVGYDDYIIKSMRRISEAYASVRLVCDNIPFYASKVMAHDEAEVVKVVQGNFYVSWQVKAGKLEQIEPFVDPDLIFGANNDLVTPRLFIEDDKINREAQIWENRLPCALTPFNAELKAGESVRLVSLAGFSPNEEMLADFLPGFKSLDDVKTVSNESKELIDDVLLPAFTVSSEPLLDAYTKQNYLDNVLRGGIPEMLPSKSGPVPLHIYSRRHGDLERDYNYFELPPIPLSSGTGNYRDICQNRRNDIWFYPELADQEIRVFTELIQADGYNPLGIKGYFWVLEEGTDPLELCPAKDDEAKKEFCNIFGKSFHPGQLLHWLDVHDVRIDNRREWLDGILTNCSCKVEAGGCEGGYWIDHWDYIVDLLEAFANIYPDRVEEVLTGKADIDWFYEGANVAPRKDKYLILSSGPLQLEAVIDNPSSKMELPAVTVFGKLCALLAVKAVSFDYECKGIEMEAGRPGWNDSMNGLPGLFGSSVCESAEVANLAGWLLKHVKNIPDTELPEEVADLIDEVINDVQEKEYCWDRSATIRENYRAQIYSKASGKSTKVSSEKLHILLECVKARAENAVANSTNEKSGLMHTFFRAVPIDVKPQKNSDGSDRLHPERSVPYADIKKFEQIPLPLFLEGQVRRLRTLDDTSQARGIYKALRRSPVFDKNLDMYKLNECLAECPAEIGRARTFTRGWFENESIWMHMSYKYLFELLRLGLFEEFYEDAKTMLVPFMNPEVYGRSVLENSSFIASSANPDKNVWGQGFVARLSGSTAEFIHIWLLMTAGKRPFFIKDGKLGFRLSPALPGQWFTKDKKTVQWNSQTVEIDENSFACTLLGTILLVYHNNSRKDTFGENGVKPVTFILDEKDTVEASSLDSELAEKIRNREIQRIDVWLE